MDTKQYVYILESNKDNSVYIGCTDNLSKRIDEHNTGLSQYTRSKIPWKLKWYAVFFNRDIVFSFEKYLKTASGKAFISKRLF